MQTSVKERKWLKEVGEEAATLKGVSKAAVKPRLGVSRSRVPYITGTHEAVGLYSTVVDTYLRWKLSTAGHQVIYGDVSKGYHCL